MKHDENRERLANALNGKTAAGDDTTGIFRDEPLADEIRRARCALTKALGENFTISGLKGQDDFLKQQIPVSLETIGFMLSVLKRAEQAEDQRRGLRAFFGHFVEAAKSFRANPGGDRWETRAKRFFHALGITNTRRQPAYNQTALFWEYMNLIYGWDEDHPGASFSNWEALETLAQRHDIASPDAVLKHLRRYASRYEQGSLKGILPGTRQQ